MVLSAPGCCAVGVLPLASAGPTPTELRRKWLGDLVAQVHHASRGTYGYRRVQAELILGRGVPVSRKLIAKIMRDGTVALNRRGAFRSGAESEMGDSLRPRWASITDLHT
jgi:transposase InsO family protein